MDLEESDSGYRKITQSTRVCRTSFTQILQLCPIFRGKYQDSSCVHSVAYITVHVTTFAKIGGAKFQEEL